jgi:hypothetical protein
MITVPTDGKTDCTAAFQAAVDLAANTGDWISLGSTPYVFSAPPAQGQTPGIKLRHNTIIEGLPGLTTIVMQGSNWGGQNNNASMDTNQPALRRPKPNGVYELSKPAHHPSVTRRPVHHAAF